MEPLDDKELNQLLRKWEAPAAPAGMRVNKRSPHPSLWKWLWSGRIHVPVPVGAAIVFGAITFWIYSSRTVQAPVAIPAGNAIVSPTAPQVSPNPPAATPPIEHTSPQDGGNDKAVSAALSGFQPVEQLEPKVVRVQP
jgi:hypothetical protein